MQQTRTHIRTLTHVHWPRHGRYDSGYISIHRLYITVLVYSIRARARTHSDKLSRIQQQLCVAVARVTAAAAAAVTGQNERNNINAHRT